MRIARYLTALWVVLAMIVLSSASTVAQNQTALINESFGYLNLSTGGGGRTGTGVDGDGAPALQQASLTASFSNFELNGISLNGWNACRSAGNTVDSCLTSLIGDRDRDGTIGLRDLHPGAIGGDTFAFDLTITNTSPPGVVLTTFAFQSKFSESPALGSRMGDKLFSAERLSLSSPAAHPLIGVKKNGTSNGLFGGKIKLICVNSSDDYPSDLNLGTQHQTLECAGGRTFDRTTNRPVLQAADGSFITATNIKLRRACYPVSR